MEDLRDTIGVFVGKRDWDKFHSPKNLAMALSVEVAEIVEHFQWLTQEESRNLPPEKLAEVREEIPHPPAADRKLGDHGEDGPRRTLRLVAAAGREPPAGGPVSDGSRTSGGRSQRREIEDPLVKW